MSTTMKKDLLLEGLGCANCAAKIEREVGDLVGVQAANVNFATGELRLELAEGDSFEYILAQTTEIVRRHEPDVIVREKHGTLSKQTSDGQEQGEHGGIKRELLTLLIGGVLLAAALLLPVQPWATVGLFLMSYLVVGGRVLLEAGRNIVRGQVFDENFLMALASIGAFAIGEYAEGVAVMLFYRVGEFVQDRAVDHSRHSIKALLDIRPDYANLVDDDGEHCVAPEDVAVGDRILVRPGERVPLDGVVADGRSALDTSALTGESMPRDVEIGDEVLSGSINQNGLLMIEVSRPFGQSTVNRILEMTQNASGRKAKTENFITKFARYYTPAVVLAAALLAVVPPLVLPGATFEQWLYRALVFLVVSCPCALVISIPLSFFGGIGGASRQGILIKGSNYLEALNDVDTVVFDKTGTLTEGRFTVTDIVPSGSYCEQELLELAAYGESHSSHPIAKSILEAYNLPVDAARIVGYEDVAGQGVRAIVDGRTVLAGNLRWLSAAGIEADDVDAPGTVVHVAVDGEYAGHIIIADRIKKDSKAAITALRALGVRHVAMLTGDRRATGERIGAQLGVDRVYSELLPDQKVEKLEGMIPSGQRRGNIVFVGDGINDAPVLARADVGVAMGGLGADAAIEAADVVLMTDEPTKLADALRLAKRTRRIVVQNIVFALSVKGIILVLGALGYATMWEAVFGDVGVALIAILNAMRLIRKPS